MSSWPTPMALEAGAALVWAPGRARHRDEQLAYSAAAAVDQHGVAFSDLSGVLHRGDRGQAGQGQTRPAWQVLLGDLIGDRGEVLGVDRDDLGGHASVVIGGAHAGP